MSTVSESRRQSLSFQKGQAVSSKSVGNYQVLETIGEGQYAKVRKAMHNTSGEIFAIKILDKQRMVTLKIQHLVKNEIGIWKNLDHPNIVKLHEVLASEEQIFIVLEFAGGGELFDRIVAAGKLTENDARVYFLQLLDALQYLHVKGVVHRDLKPENLLLSTAGQLKLADFGFAVLIDGLAHEEKCRQVGSPNYMAPELLTQAAADPEYPLELIDIYDSGCILYVMCAGCLPFPEDGELLDQKIVMGSWIAPAHFSSNLKALLVRLMEPDWRRRYSSINQIRSHNWVRDVKELVIPVPMAIKDVPTRLSDKGKDLKNMTFSDLEMVRVVPKRKQSSVPSDGPPFINCFEFLANVGIFDLSRMVVNSQRKYYAFSVHESNPKDLLGALAKIVGEEKKVKLEVVPEKFRIRCEGKSNVVMVIQIFRISTTVHLIDCKKMRGSLLEFAHLFKNIRAKVEAAYPIKAHLSVGSVEEKQVK